MQKARVPACLPSSTCVRIQPHPVRGGAVGSWELVQPARGAMGQMWGDDRPVPNKGGDPA